MFGLIHPKVYSLEGNQPDAAVRFVSIFSRKVVVGWHLLGKCAAVGMFESYLIVTI